MVRRTVGPRRTRTWHTFIQNHAKETWACDFLTQYTAFFAVACVFVVMAGGSRRIVHDNGGIFGQFGGRLTVEENGRERSYRCHLDRWLHEVMGIDDLPIPFGAPNANPHAERLARTLRTEAVGISGGISLEGCWPLFEVLAITPARRTRTG